MKKAPLIFAIAIISIFVISCKEKPTDPVNTLQITAISPSSAKVGDTILITGKGFSNSQDSNFVMFNNIKVTQSISWSDIEIKTKVPIGATTGKISVTVNKIRSNEVDFTIESTTTSNFDSVKIGSQVWMLKNLDVVHYRNGDPIPEVKDSTEWRNLKTGAWCNINNDPANSAVYGKLYNWYAVNDPRGLAPEGWHIPSDFEFEKLFDWLGGRNIAGNKLKEAGTEHWANGNFGSTNSSGFTALPAGIRDAEQSVMDFYPLSFLATFWTCTEYSSKLAWLMIVSYSDENSFITPKSKKNGSSVRCVKD